MTADQVKDYNAAIEKSKEDKGLPSFKEVVDRLVDFSNFVILVSLFQVIPLESRLGSATIPA